MQTFDTPETVSSGVKVLIFALANTVILSFWLITMMILQLQVAKRQYMSVLIEKQSLESQIESEKQKSSELKKSDPEKIQPWVKLIRSAKICEPLLSLFITYLSKNLPSQNKFVSKRTSVNIFDKEPNAFVFNLVSVYQPEILAIIDNEGTILQFNHLFMSTYYFQFGVDWIGKNFLNLLVPESADKAKINLDRFDRKKDLNEEKYGLKSVAGKYVKHILASEVSFKKIDDSSVSVHIDSRFVNNSVYQPLGHYLGNKSLPYKLHDLSDVLSRSICCVNEANIITYASQSAAMKLGLDSNVCQGVSFDQLISSKQIPKYSEAIKTCQQGDRLLMEFEIHSPDDNTTPFLFDIYPIMAESNTYLGSVIDITSVVDIQQTEEKLKRRLMIENLIAEISSRFVSLKTDDLDQEISEVICLLEIFENAKDCSIEINKIENKNCHILFRSKSSNADHQSARQSNAGAHAKFERLAVPILVQNEIVGNFYLNIDKYHNNWIDDDVDLIGTIGELIINALVRKQNEMCIRLNENRLYTTLQSIGDAVIATDQNGKVSFMNEQAEVLTGWTWKEASLMPFTDIFKPVDQFIPSSAFAPVSRNPDILVVSKEKLEDKNLMLKSRNGSQFFISLSQAPIIDQNETFFGRVTVFRDITLKKQEEDRIRYISYHDKLTDLFNRAFFEEELIRLNTKRQYPITIILCDCNGLKIANDIFGHLEGDRLLVTIANILKKATRREDIVARWGGDEFAIILPQTDEDAASNIKHRIQNLCMNSKQDPIQPSLAIGSATNSDGSCDLINLLKIAEDRMYRHKLMESKSARNTLLRSIEKMVYEKSFETEEHASRIADIACKVGRVIGLEDYEMEELKLLSVLHDIGKIGIPDQILLKPGKLTEAEWEIMKKHSEKGFNLAKSTPELVNIADSILHHHERWDGKGYPSGLRGEEIPKLARILSIIDSYDVITHARTYKDASSKDFALSEIERCSGTQFDPNMTKVFVDIMKDKK